MVYATIEAQPAPKAERTGYHSIHMDCGSLDELTVEVARSLAHNLWVAEVGLHHRVGSLLRHYDLTYTRILSNFVRLVAEITRLRGLSPVTSGDDFTIQVVHTLWRGTFWRRPDLQSRFVEICQRLLKDGLDSDDDDYLVFAEVGSALREFAGLPPAP